MAYKIICDSCGVEIADRSKLRTMYKDFQVEVRVYREGHMDADICPACLKGVRESLERQYTKP